MVQVLEVCLHTSTPCMHYSDRRHKQLHVKIDTGDACIGDRSLDARHYSALETPSIRRAFMKIRIALAASFVAATSLLSHLAIAQTDIYVDPNHGSDTQAQAAGTQSQPLKTINAGISKALALNKTGVATRVMVSPGTYRELIDLSATGGQSSAPITLQAATAGQAVISGSDVVTGWSHSSGSTYTHSYNYNFGGCPNIQKPPKGSTAIAYYRDLIFVNGRLLTQVLSSSSLRAGTFYIDRSSKVAHIWPFAGTNMSTATVEIGMRPDTLRISGRSNVTVRGMTFTHAVTCLNSTGVTVTSSHNVLFDQDQAIWNNWGGFGASGTDHVTFQNSVASHNGGVGFTAFRNTNITYYFDEADYNNWRGALGNFIDYAGGGLKSLQTHTGTVRKFYAFHNQAQGLWFDTDNKNILMDDVTLVGNNYSNMQIELNQGPVRLQNSLICSGSNGINMLEAQDFTVTNTKIYNNGGTAKFQAQLFLAGKPGGRTVTDWQTHQSYNLRTVNLQLSGNTFQDNNGGQYVFATYTSGTDWSAFARSVHSNGNHWGDPGKSAAFDLPGNHHVDLSGWRGATGQDGSSSWGISNSVKALCSAQPNVVNAVALTAAQTVYTMTAGTATVNLNVKSLGQTAPIQLSTAKLPQGVTASITQSSPTGGTATVTVKASPDAVAGTVPVTVFAQKGDQVHSVTVAVAVDPQK